MSYARCPTPVSLYSSHNYHLNDLDSLGWELTVCNSLHPEKSPCRSVLKRSRSYGAALFDFLSRHMPMERIRSIVEIGGGYGFLMQDFLKRLDGPKVLMVDISPYLLEKQKETLKGYPVQFRREDFLETDPAIMRDMDLAVLNESLGDFPVVLNMGRDAFNTHHDGADACLEEVWGLFEKYALDMPAAELFHFNIGAIRAVEKLCASGVGYIFLCEHSCESEVPGQLKPFVRLAAAGIPEKISLRGHDEYTIKFSYLQKVARFFNYTSVRGPLADFLEFDFTPGLRFILASHAVAKDEYEIIRHFIGDLYKYEYLILMKSDTGQPPAD